MWGTIVTRARVVLGSNFQARITGTGRGAGFEAFLSSGTAWKVERIDEFVFPFHLHHPRLAWRLTNILKLRNYLKPSKIFWSFRNTWKLQEILKSFKNSQSPFYSNAHTRGSPRKSATHKTNVAACNLVHYERNLSSRLTHQLEGVIN